jgi:hypothetical protein
MLQRDVQKLMEKFNRRWEHFMERQDIIWIFTIRYSDNTERIFEDIIPDMLSGTNLIDVGDEYLDINDIRSLKFVFEIR